MIGQNVHKKVLSMQIEDGNFPKFSIIYGEVGSGKHELVKFIYEQMKERDSSTVLYESENTVDAVRKVISDAYKIVGVPVVYVFYNADNMSMSAKNAMLKLAEEPPKSASIIMTISNRDKIMNTLYSRASVYYMQPYSIEELQTYTKQTFPDEKNIEEVCKICDTPGKINEVETISNNNVMDLYEYVNKVLDNLADVTIANAFKMADRIALKDTDTGKYSLQIFFRAVNNVILKRITDAHNMSEELSKWHNVVGITVECMETLERTPAINKLALLDLWIMKFRYSFEESA